MADKKKTSNSFRNTSYENELSKVVQSIDRWEMDVAKCEKMSVCLCNDFALIISEFCGILRRPFFKKYT